MLLYFRPGLKQFYGLLGVSYFTILKPFFREFIFDVLLNLLFGALFIVLKQLILIQNALYMVDCIHLVKQPYFFEGVHIIFAIVMIEERFYYLLVSGIQVLLSGFLKGSSPVHEEMF